MGLSFGSHGFTWPIFLFHSNCSFLCTSPYPISSLMFSKTFSMDWALIKPAFLPPFSSLHKRQLFLPALLCGHDSIGRQRVDQIQPSSAHSRFNSASILHSLLFQLALVKVSKELKPLLSSPHPFSRLLPLSAFHPWPIGRGCCFPFATLPDRQSGPGTPWPIDDGHRLLGMLPPLLFY